MTQDPFGLRHRKPISFETFGHLFSDQQSKTFTGGYLSTCPAEKIAQRHDELNKLEEEQGFVHVGEKQWLAEYLDTGNCARYDQWVTAAFDSLGVEFVYSEYSSNPDFPDKVWAAELSSSLLIARQIEFKGNFAVDDELSLSVFGAEQGPGLCHLVKLFELLSGIEYFIAEIEGEHRSDTFVTVTGVAVTHPSSVMSWDIEFQSEYGAEWDQTIRVPWLA